MPIASPSPSLTAPPLVSIVYVVTLFDPRRWVGAIFAILGIVASVIVPFLPAGVSQRLVRSETTVIVPRRRHERNASQMTETSSSTPVVHAFIPQSAQTAPKLSRHSNRLCSFTQRPSRRRSITPEPSPRAYLPTPISRTDPSPPINTRRLGDAISGCNNFRVTKNLTSVFPPAHIIYRDHCCEPRRSLESLDLATPANPQPVTPSPQPSTVTKVTFHVPDPYSHRRASTDYYQYRSKDGTVSTASGGYPTTGVSELGQYWRGNDSFAVKRSTTLPTQTEPLPARRKFFLFGRDRDNPSQSPKNLTSPPLSPKVIALEPNPLPVLSLSGGPISPLSDDLRSPAAASDGSVGDTTPIDQFSMPPERARRTDPYKQFNIPVPGTERAKAFLRAEKEWVKAETKRREQEKLNRVSQEATQQSALEILTSKVETEKPQKKDRRACSVDRPRLKRPSFPSRKSSSTEDEALPSAALVEPGNETDLDDRDYEGHRPTLTILDIPNVDEFGALSAPLSAVPEEDYPVASSSKVLSEVDMSETVVPSRPSSAQGKRVWVFLKRPESRGATAKKSKEDKIENDKSKRPKSMDTKVGLPFGSSGKKDGGYVSDTAVTSLTYQLIS